jgi:SAM-dependent methyltransferase
MNIKISEIIPEEIKGIEESKLKELRKQLSMLLNFFDQNKGNYRIGALKRYIKQIENFKIDPGFANYLKKRIIPKNAKRFLDLGCASGNLLNEIRGCRKDLSLKGFDINPKFVVHANKKGVDADIDMIDINMPKLKGIKFDCVITNLTLDRVADPRKLIENVIEHTRNGGCFIIGTLLPIESNDRKFADKVTEYTEPNKKITRGVDLKEDKEQLINLIRKEFKQDISLVEYPYTKNSPKGELYENYFLLYGIKKII